MNQLNKLIQQYEAENPREKAFSGEFGWREKFVLWLASRPTCGLEQRKFLDEVEKFIIVDDLSGQAIARKETESPVMFQVHYIADLQKVIKGE